MNQPASISYLLSIKHGPTVAVKFDPSMAVVLHSDQAIEGAKMMIEGLNEFELSDHDGAFEVVASATGPNVPFRGQLPIGSIMSLSLVAIPFKDQSPDLAALQHAGDHIASHLAPDELAGQLSS